MKRSSLTLLLVVYFLAFCIFASSLHVYFHPEIAIAEQLHQAEHNANERRRQVDAARYDKKAVASVRKASGIVHNFKNATDRADYALGLEHIANVHRSVGSYTIRQVLAIGQSVRLAPQIAAQAAADRKRQVERDAANESTRQSEIAHEANEAHLQHGEPECLTEDNRSLGSTSDDYVSYVTGTVKNSCSRDFSYVQVELNFYDSSGNLKSSGLANVNNLGAGDSWSWKTVVTDPGGSYKIMKITGA